MNEKILCHHTNCICRMGCYILSTLCGEAISTEQEMASFDSVLVSYLKDHFADISVQGDATSFQKLTKVEFCCVDEFDNKVTYIVDLWFKTRLYDHLRLDYDGHMIQRSYFTMDAPDRIKKDARGFEMIDSTESLRIDDMTVRGGWRSVVEKE